MAISMIDMNIRIVILRVDDFVEINFLEHLLLIMSIQPINFTLLFILLKLLN